MPPLLSFLNVSKRYADGEREITVLDCVSLEVEAGVSVGILGRGAPVSRRSCASPPGSSWRTPAASASTVVTWDI